MDLATTIAGVKFRNPVLPASGPLGCDAFALKHLEGLGVGAMVAKTISTKAAIVPKPCIQRVGKDGMLNCETWSEKTWEEWVGKEYPQLMALRQAGCPLVISIGYQASEIEFLAEKVAPFADVIEISTHYVKDSPEPIIEGVKAAKRGSGGHVPVWIKMSPHASAMAEYAQAAENAGADVIVAINSVGPCQSFDTTGKPFLGSGGGWGWLTGQPIKPVAQHFVRQVVEAVKVPVVGVGGIGSAKDVLEMLWLGASAVQLCTAPMLRGPKLFTKIVDELGKTMKQPPAEVVGKSKPVFVDVKDDYHARVNVTSEQSCVDCMLCEGACAYLAMHVAPVPKGGRAAEVPAGKHVWIDYDRCVHCGACVSVCPAPGTLGVTPGA
jgi:dihydroorotate dehydrogenase